MKGFVGIVNFNNNKISENLKNKLFKNFSTNNDLNVSKVTTDTFLTYFSGDNCYFYKDHKSKFLTFFYGHIINFKELALKFNLKDSDNPAELISVAFHSIGEDSIREINGAFTLFIFDQKLQKITAYKDHMGQKPFFFSEVNNSLVFATDIKQIIDLGLEKYSLNRRRVIYFLTYLCGPHSETFFNNVLRLPARNSLQASKNHLGIKEYYQFKRNKIKVPDEEVIKQLRQILVKTITSNLPKKKIASKLSGGLDSSTISAVLINYHDKEYIDLFSGVYDLDLEELENVNEYEYIESFTEFHSKETSYVSFNSFDSLNPFLFSDADYEPNFIMSRYFDNAFLKEASNRNIDCIFDGFDGDSIISYGNNYLFDLGKQFKLNSLFKEKKLMENAGFLKKRSSFRFLLKYVFWPNIPYWLKNIIDKIRGVKTHQLTNYETLIPQVRRNFPFEEIKTSVGDLSINFMKSQEIHRKVVEWPLWEHILDIVHKDSQKYDIDEKHPFLNKDLIELSLNAKPTLKMKNGITRYMLRQSVKDIIPNKIYSRSNKSDLSPPIDKFFSLMKQRKNYLDLLVGKDSPIVGLIDRSQIIEMYENDDPKNNQYLTCLINLSIWMKKFNFKWLD